MTTQNHPSDNDLGITFAPETDNIDTTSSAIEKWKILIVDDEPDVHEVTQLGLHDFEFSGAGLQFLNAYSAQQAKTILATHSDISVAFIDVVMESECAGLELIKYIREVLNNQSIRLILRTGQPGQAPERDVIRAYDINDYKEKTELSAHKLDSTVYTSLRSYQSLISLENNQRGLKHIIHASSDLYSIPNLNEFIQGVLKQLISLLSLGDDAFYVGCECVALEHEQDKSTVIAATGRFTDAIGKNPIETLCPEVCEILKQAHANKKSILREKEFVGYFEPQPGREDIIYVNSRHPISNKEMELFELFLHNVSSAYENIILHNEIEGTQRDMLYMLGESVETRSKETGQHVRRVASYCRLIATGIGLSKREIDIIEIASPLHDFGKIGIADNILNKPGKLTADEWEVMQTHANIGYELLNNSKREILKAAAIIAGQHHEKWDGTGYPNRLKAKEIHIYARIAAIADVFDALGTKRCYKEAWEVEKIIEYLKEQKGKQFEPRLIDWVIDNIDSFKQVRATYPDAE